MSILDEYREKLEKEIGLLHEEVRITLENNGCSNYDEYRYCTSRVHTLNQMREIISDVYKDITNNDKEEDTEILGD